MSIRMFQTSWPRLQGYWQMSSYEAKVVKVIVSAAVAEYRRAQKLEASMPLASVVDDPNDQEAIAELSSVLSKVWRLSKGRQAYGFAIVEDWTIPEESEILTFRVSPMVVELFDGIDMSESLH